MTPLMARTDEYCDGIVDAVQDKTIFPPQITQIHTDYLKENLQKSA